MSLSCLTSWSPALHCTASHSAALCAASLISLLGDTPDEKFFYSKIAAPLKAQEIKYMQTFGIDDGDGLLDAKEFVVLTIIRIGKHSVW